MDRSKKSSKIRIEDRTGHQEKEKYSCFLIGIFIQSQYFLWISSFLELWIIVKGNLQFIVLYNPQNSLANVCFMKNIKKHCQVIIYFYSGKFRKLCLKNHGNLLLS